MDSMKWSILNKLKKCTRNKEVQLSQLGLVDEAQLTKVAHGHPLHLSSWVVGVGVGQNHPNLVEKNAHFDILTNLRILPVTRPLMVRKF